MGVKLSFGLISVWFFSWSMQNDKISRRVRHPPRLWALKYIFSQIRKTMRKIKPLRSVFNLLKIYRNESLLKVRKNRWKEGRFLTWKLRVYSWIQWWQKTLILFRIDIFMLILIEKHLSQGEKRFSFIILSARCPS